MPASLVVEHMTMPAPIFVEHVMKCGGTFVCNAFMASQGFVPQRNRVTHKTTAKLLAAESHAERLGYRDNCRHCPEATCLNPDITRDEARALFQAHPGWANVTMNEPGWAHGKVSQPDADFDTRRFLSPSGRPASFWRAFTTVLLVRDPFARFISWAKMDKFVVETKDGSGRLAGVAAVLGSSSCATSNDCLWGAPCLYYGACDYESCDAWHAWTSAMSPPGDVKSRGPPWDAPDIDARSRGCDRSKTSARADAMLSSVQLKMQRENFVTQHLVSGFRTHRECLSEVVRLAKQAVDRFTVVLNMADLPEDSDLLAQRFLNIHTVGGELDRQVGLANIHSPQTRTPAHAGAHVNNTDFEAANKCDMDIVEYANDRVRRDAAAIR